MLMLGPVTVAFAVPIWQQRALLARHWPTLLIGMLAGSAASIASSLGLSKVMALDISVVMSLIPGEEGSVAGLVMVLTGILNLFAAPLLVWML